MKWQRLLMLLVFSIVAWLQQAMAEINDPLFAKVNDYFLSVKQQKIDVEAFIANMPKGGDLHNHFIGAIYPEKLLEYVKNDPKHAKWCIYGPDYVATIDPDCGRHGGKLLSLLNPNTPLYRDVVDAWSMTRFQLVAPEFGHTHFFDVFAKFDRLVHYEPYQPEMLADLMRQAAAQHINYLELMFQPDADGGSQSVDYGRQYITHLPADPNNITQRQVVQAIEALDAHQFQTKIVKQNIVDRAYHIVYTARHDVLHCQTKRPLPAACRVIVRFKYMANRTQQLNEVLAAEYAGLSAMRQAPDLFVGIDLVALEDSSMSLKYYSAQMQAIAYLRNDVSTATHRYYYMSLHAGEITRGLMRDLPLTADHIYQAVTIAKADRIGHGVDLLFELPRHNDLIRKMRQNKVMVEINLTSNEEILGICDKQPYCQPPFQPYKPTGGYPYNHPFYFYLTHGIPLELSTDDQGLEETNLTKEYIKASNRYPISYSDLKYISRNSLTYSFLPGGQLWRSQGDYRHLVAACSGDNPYSNNIPSAKCYNYLQENLKAQLQWNLERQFYRFEKRYDDVSTARSGG